MKKAAWRAAPVLIAVAFLATVPDIKGALADGRESPMPSASSAGPVFFEALRDVPVMPGLTELPEQAVVFDKPDGRIAESVALRNGATQAGIEAFYLRTLPQLGWSPAGANAYVRGGESLSLSFPADEGSSLVRFRIVPR